MAHARCIECGKVVSWRAQRGSRLTDLRCSCGGELKGMTAGQKSKNKGIKYVTCWLCGKRKAQRYTLITDSRYIDWRGRIIPEGVTICKWHERKPLERYFTKQQN
jgi:hypothetical protein